MSITPNKFNLLVSKNNKVSKINLLNLTETLKINGVSGTQGNPGFIGFQGDMGITGIEGPTGFQGESPTGLPGNIGPTGAQGAQGSDVVGPTGPTGAQGTTGAQGAVGPPGSNIVGPQGSDGPLGPQGAPGAQATSYLQLSDTPSSFGSIPWIVPTVNTGGTGIFHGNVKVYNTATANDKSTHSMLIFGDASDRSNFFNKYLIGGSQQVISSEPFNSNYGLYVSGCQQAFLFSDKLSGTVKGKCIMAISGTTAPNATATLINADYSSLIDSTTCTIDQNRGTILSSINSDCKGSFSSIIVSEKSLVGTAGKYCSVVGSYEVSISDVSASSYSSIICSSNDSNINGNFSTIICCGNRDDYSDTNLKCSVTGNYSSIIGSENSSVSGNFSSITNSKYGASIAGDFCFANYSRGSSITNASATYCSIFGSTDCEISAPIRCSTIMNSDDSNIYDLGIGLRNYNMILSGDDLSYIGNSRFSQIMGSKESFISSTGRAQFSSIISSGYSEISGSDTPRESSILASNNCSIKFDARNGFIVASKYSQIADSTSASNGFRSSIIACKGSNVTPMVNAGSYCSIIGSSSPGTTSIAAGTSFRMRVRQIRYTNLNCISDKRNKKEILPVEEDKEILEKIKNVKTYTFRMKDENPMIPVSRGFIAQEVEELFPHFIDKEAINKVNVIKTNGIWKKEKDNKTISTSTKIYFNNENNEQDKGYILETTDLNHLTIDSYFVSCLLWKGIQMIGKRKEKLEENILKMESIITEIEKKLNVKKKN
tara:strand:- start:54 stop:2363 length:2310 start_codon:yes stop_codon:yes gene_type:complete